MESHESSPGASPGAADKGAGAGTIRTRRGDARDRSGVRGGPNEGEGIIQCWMRRKPVGGTAISV